MKNIKEKLNKEILKRAQIPKQVRDDAKASVQDDEQENSAKPRVAIAMSGGVDSSVAAKILKDQGYDVVGFMMKLWSDPSSSCSSRENACCDDQGVMDAKKVADLLGIPFYLVNAKEIFKKKVADYFLNEYKNLRTPNPCVVCNEKIKFGWLLDFAKSIGCQYLATGHYAKIVGSRESRVGSKNASCPTPHFKLLKGADPLKDQSYFLYRLNQDQLSRIMFPVGEHTKEQVRAMAKKWNLPVFEKRESQEICFIQDKDFREFLKRNIPSKYFKSGDIVDKDGAVLGRHEGLINYTIGQRRGIDQKSDNRIQITVNKKPLYVIGFNKDKNQLIVGEDSEIYRGEMEIGDIHFIQNTDNRIHPPAGRAGITEDLKVKIRYRHPAVKISNFKYQISNENPNSKTQIPKSMRIVFEEKQRAITPGQSAVFYEGDEVIGGGIIQ